MRKKIGLFLIGGALVTGLISGCNASNTPVSDSGGSVANVPQVATPVSNFSVIPTRVVPTGQPQLPAATVPNIPPAPAPDNPRGALLHDTFSDTSLNAYYHANVSASSNGAFQWTANANRLILKGDASGNADETQQEVFLSRQKNFSNYTVSLDLYRGDTIASGLVFSAVDQEHYYSFTFGPPNSSGLSHAYLWKVDGLDKQPLKIGENANVNLPTTGFQHISVTVFNGDIVAKVNGVNVISAHENTITTIKGGVGIFTSASLNLAVANLNVVSAQAAN